LGRLLVRLLRKSIITVSLLTAFHCGAAANTLPNVTAQAWVVANSDGNILQGVNTDTVRSIASITKLMTAMVVLDTVLSACH
jgi:D-alanyl-D-alanine carboxypeptidase